MSRLEHHGATEWGCAVCLDKIVNECKPDGCTHSFCFVCLLEWAKRKQSCPLCVTLFKNIRYNFVSPDDFSEYNVELFEIMDDSSADELRAYYDSDSDNYSGDLVDGALTGDIVVLENVLQQLFGPPSDDLVFFEREFDVASVSSHDTVLGTTTDGASLEPSSDIDVFEVAEAPGSSLHGSSVNCV